MAPKPDHPVRALLRHRWHDVRDAHRAVPPEMAERLARRVVASERRHTGQIRICVESSLPTSYLWRHLGQRVPMAELVRQRGLMMFSKLRVWDTEHNNGVLIYLLLAEHAIELVADRGLARVIDASRWRALADQLGATLRAGHFEEGLSAALEAASALLEQHFPAPADGMRPNELPDAPVLR